MSDPVRMWLVTVTAPEGNGESIEMKVILQRRVKAIAAKFAIMALLEMVPLNLQQLQVSAGEIPDTEPEINKSA